MTTQTDSSTDGTPDDDQRRREAVGQALRRLRKGRGLRSPDLTGRIGPELRALLRIRLDAGPADVLRDLQAGVVEAARRMPADLREAVLVGLAVEGWSDQPFLTDRIDAIAAAMDRDARTARRRLDTATDLLAASLFAGPRGGTGNLYAPPGWFVESLASVVRIDAAGARLTEDRVVVADVDGLDTVYATLSVPPRDRALTPDLSVLAEAGCRIRGASRVSGSYWRYELALPRPLRAGEEHRYVISFSVTDREALHPFYVLIPLRCTRRFSAEVHFPTADAVAPVWRLDGVPQVVLGDDTPTEELLEPDPTGVVRVQFEELVQGLCYGIQWRWR